MNSAEFGRFITAETEKWAKVINTRASKRSNVDLFTVRRSIFPVGRMA